VQFLACSRGPGVAVVAGDCDDNDPTVAAPALWVADVDGDGYGAGPVLGPASCTAPQADAVVDSPTDDCVDTDAAVFPGALELCGDLIDSDCDGADCANWIEDFEAGPPLPADFTTSGNANWRVDGSAHHTGLYSGGSGNISDNQTSSLYLDVVYSTDGTISFWHSGNTEVNYDYLHFYVDGVQKFEQSGTWGWTYRVANVLAGPHTFKWSYTKDVSISVRADTVWIDDLELIGGAP
jgi:hypothetical protein